ncbi:MAG: hypothetical protein HXY35_12155, partial [Chloroflexi bacterium]|nr:hypothetical protein [Chloroflexota bacterium]
MRIYRLASFAIATLLLTVLLVTPALSAASSSSTVLTPLSLSAQSGNP